jgi:toxin ParE1/3/4
VRQKPVVRRRLANDDIDSALLYYLKEAGPEIAADFVDELEKTIKGISRQPKLGSPRYGHELQIPGLRHWPIKRFPHVIFYREKEIRIEISRVLHGSMDIPAWVRELE